MGQFCVLRQSVILVLDAVFSNIPIFSWRLDEVLSFLLVYWTTSDDEYLQRYHVPRFAYQTIVTPVEENDDTNAVLSYMCGYQGTLYLNLGIVKIARAWSVLIRL